MCTGVRALLQGSILTGIIETKDEDEPRRQLRGNGDFIKYLTALILA